MIIRQREIGYGGNYPILFDEEYSKLMPLRSDYLSTNKFMIRETLEIAKKADIVMFGVGLVIPHEN